jgi:hypothetical protein
MRAAGPPLRMDTFATVFFLLLPATVAQAARRRLRRRQYLKTVLAAAAGFDPVHATEGEAAAEHLTPGAAFAQPENAEDCGAHR